MDKQLAQILFEHANKVPPQSLVLYLLLRADIALGDSITVKQHKSENRLVSGMSIAGAAKRMGTSEVVAKGLFCDLVKRGWIKGLPDKSHQLGVIIDHDCKWFIGEAVENLGRPSASATIRALLRESEERKRAARAKASKPALSPSATRRAASDIFVDAPKGGDSRLRPLFDLFKKRWREKYHSPLPLIEDSSGGEYRIPYGMLKNALRWAGNRSTLEKYINWLFDNWEALCKASGLTGKPTFNVLGSKKLFFLFKSWMDDGIPKTARGPKPIDGRISKRFEDTEEDGGW